MATLINKANPQIRITAPEIGTGTHGYYYVCNVGYPEDKWTLVEEEPEFEHRRKDTIYFLETAKTHYADTSELKKCIEWLKGLQPTEGIKGNLEEISSNVDLENEAVAFCFDNGINVTPYQATRIARHFYELGLNARKKE